MAQNAVPTFEIQQLLTGGEAKMLTLLWQTNTISITPHILCGHMQHVSAQNHLKLIIRIRLQVHPTNTTTIATARYKYLFHNAMDFHFVDCGCSALLPRVINYTCTILLAVFTLFQYWSLNAYNAEDADHKFSISLILLLYFMPHEISCTCVIDQK